MKLSLSGRLLDGAPPMATPDFIHLAARAGYDLVELRLHQLPPSPGAAPLAAIRQALADTRLGVSMIVVGSPANLPQWLPLATALGTSLLRVNGTADELQAACQQLPDGLHLAAQMHSSSPYETIRDAAAYLQQLPDPRFGLMPEPANLLFAGETWAPDTFAPLRGRILGCNAQSIVLDPAGTASVPMNDGRTIHYRRVNWPDNPDLQLGPFIASLRHAGYNDFINFIDPAMPGRDLEDYATETARYARAVLASVQ